MFGGDPASNYEECYQGQNPTMPSVMFHQRPPSSTMINFYRPQPSPQIVPTKLDVLYGRGSKINQHGGNILFRKIVEHNKLLYRTCKKHEKTAVAQAIVEALESRSPPIRFLEIGNYTMKKAQQIWVLVPKERAIRKTIQALRERAREKCKKNSQDNKGENNSEEEDITISSDFDTSTTDNTSSSLETKSSIDTTEPKSSVTKDEIAGQDDEKAKNSGKLQEEQESSLGEPTIKSRSSSPRSNPNTLGPEENVEVENLMRNLLQGSDIYEWNLEKEDATAKKLIKQGLMSMQQFSGGDVTMKDSSMEEKAWANKQQRESSDDSSLVELSSVDTPVSNLQLTASFDFKETDWMRDCDFEE